jgi:membrane protease YdiL (CAAX protease family)
MSLITYIVFLAIWTLRVVMLKPLIDAKFDLWTKEIINGVIKSIIWVGFAVYLIKLYDVDLKIKLKKMFAMKIKAKTLLPILGIFLAYHLIAMFLMHRGFYLNPKFHPSQLIGQFLLVGVLEETLFRGWFLNTLSSFLRDWEASAITSVMFVLIHIPSWTVNGLSTVTMISTSIGIFVLSMVFGWTFMKGQSLWTPIVLHMIWDVLSITVL